MRKACKGTEWMDLTMWLIWTTAAYSLRSAIRWLVDWIGKMVMEHRDILYPVPYHRRYVVCGNHGWATYWYRVLCQLGTWKCNAKCRKTKENFSKVPKTSWNFFKSFITKSMPGLASYQILYSIFTTIYWKTSTHHLKNERINILTQILPANA